MLGKKSAILAIILAVSGIAIASQPQISIEDGFKLTENEIYHDSQEDPIVEWVESEETWLFNEQVLVPDSEEEPSSGTVLNYGSANQIYLNKEGDQMEGPLNMNEEQITNIDNITGENIIDEQQVTQDAVTSTEIDEDDIYQLSWENLDLNQTDIDVEDIELGTTDGEGLYWDPEHNQLNVDAGNALVIEGSSVSVAEDGITSSELDETTLYELNWGNLEIEQEDVDIEDVNLEDTDGAFLEWNAETETYHVLSEQMSWSDLDIDESDTYQDLSHVLEQGNTADEEINMDKENIEQVENLETTEEGCIGQYCGEQ